MGSGASLILPDIGPEENILESYGAEYQVA